MFPGIGSFPLKTQPNVTLGKESCEVPGKGGLWVPDVTLPNSPPLPAVFLPSEILYLGEN